MTTTTKPTSFTSLLVSSTDTAANGSSDSVPGPTIVNGSAVDAALEIRSATGGLLMPRLTTSEMNALNASEGLMIYNLTEQSLYVYDGATWDAAGGGGGGVTEISTGAGLTGGPITDTGTISIPNSSVVAGAYTKANVTVDARGIVTSASNGAAVTSITAGAGLSGGTSTATGTISIPNSGVSVGSYTNASITVNGVGIITAASNGTTAVTTLNGTAGRISVTGAGTTRTIDMISTGVSPNTYVSPTIVVDTYGRITSATTGKTITTGTATLVSGQATVNTALVTAASKIFLSYANGTGASASATDVLSSGTIIANTSFVISTAGTSTKTVDWMVVT